MPSTTTYNSSRPYVVLIGLDSMQGIQAARIMAEHKVPVIAIAKDAKHPNCLTNCCQEILFAPQGEEDILNHLRRLGPQFSQKAVLMPCQDSNVFTVSAHRQELCPWYHIALPKHETVAMLMDKLTFCEFALASNLPIPKTYILRSREDALNATKDIGFPCILKPPYRSAEWSKNTSLKAFKVADAEELVKLYDHYSQWADVLMAQQWIAGEESSLYSCNCYYSKESQALVTFVARKLRQWPPQTGQSSLGEECRDDVVLNQTLQLFDSVNYYGLGYVEIKKDANSGEYFIVEPNIGRPTGRSAIAEAGGVELLYTMYCDVAGLPLPENRTQTYQNVKWIHLRRDFQSAFYYWRRGELSLKDWAASLRGRKGYAVFSWRDLKPFFGDLWMGVQIFTSKEERSKRGL